MTDVQDEWPRVVFGIAMADGSLFSMLERFYETLEDAEERIRWLHKHSRAEDLYRPKKFYLMDSED